MGTPCCGGKMGQVLFCLLNTHLGGVHGSLSISPGVMGEEGGRFGLLETQHVLVGTTGRVPVRGCSRCSAKASFSKPSSDSGLRVCEPWYAGARLNVEANFLALASGPFFRSLQTSVLIPRQVHYRQLNGTPGGAGCANTPAAGETHPNQQQRPLLAPARLCRSLTTDIWQGLRGWRHREHRDPCSGHPRWLPALLRQGGMDVMLRTTYFYLVPDRHAVVGFTPQCQLGGVVGQPSAGQAGWFR